MPIEIPQDVYDLVMDELYSDRESLRACAIVCRSWLPTARRLLFTKITVVCNFISPRPFQLMRDTYGKATVGENRAHRLYTLFTKSPEVADYVRVLRLAFFVPNFWEDRFLDPGMLYLVERLLQKLVRLRQLDFYPQPVPSISQRKALPLQPFLGVVADVLRLETLKCIRLCAWWIDCIDELSSVLDQCPNLECLGLASSTICSTMTADEHRKLASKLSPRIKCLELNRVNFIGDDNWLKALTFLVSELRLTLWEQDAREYVKHVGSKLERLHVIWGNQLHPLDLSSSHGLRSLWLTMPHNVVVLPWTALVLMSVPSPYLLEQVTIDIRMDPRYMQGSWSLLNDFFSRKELTSLREVNVCLPAPRDGPQVRRITESLPSLQGRGILRMFGLGWSDHFDSLTPMISSYDPDP